MYFTTQTVAAAALFFAGTAVSAPTEASSSSCVKGIHMIVARGSLEPQGQGRLKSVTDTLIKDIPHSDASAIVYPALEGDDYNSSEDQGVGAMTKQIKHYVDGCPDAKIVLLGYSQGGQVISDTLGGSSYSDRGPLDDKYRSNILAAVMFADPSHVAGKPYDAGSAQNSGIFAKADTTALDTYSDELLSLCATDDAVCDSGSSVPVHLHEVKTYHDKAVKFVKNKAS